MTDLRPSPTGPRSTEAPGRFVSLRTKVVVFFSVMLIAASSALSGYFVETRRVAMVDQLRQLGTILLTNTIGNAHFRFAGLIAEDRKTLDEFLDGLMAIDHVAYVVVTGADGHPLARRTKLASPSAARTAGSEAGPYPDGRIVAELLRTPEELARVTQLAPAPDGVLRRTDPLPQWFWFFISWKETLYDFAMPVMRSAASDSPFMPFALESAERSPKRDESVPRPVLGVIQIGITDALVKTELLATIRNVMLLTALIITMGILGAHLFTRRITTPLRNLATAARRLAEGTSPDFLVSSTHDEVGQLTGMFNVMTHSLRERNQAITNHLDIIRRQVGQLTTVHETSAALAHTLNLRELLDTVLELLMTNLGFSRMVLMLRPKDYPLAYVAQVAGVQPDILPAALRVDIPIQADGTILGDLFLNATPVLVPDLEAEAHRMHAETLAIARRVGIVSFVAVPLQSQNRILGLLGGDRGAVLCTSDDLTILLTIAGHVAAAIDNAQAYARLSELTQHLEQRIQERTVELSVANQRLQDHDRRRSMFISVASHELRTPMTAIRSFTDNMLDGVAGTLTPQQSTYLNRIAHNLNRLTRIINQLLDWSRLDLRKDTLHVEHLCIRQITGIVVDSLRSVAEQKQVSLEVEVPDRLPAIEGDRDKLEQILWNLAGNAVKFTPAGGRVTVSFHPLPAGWVEVCVRDTGCGIAPDHLPRVFDEFSKVPSALPTSQGAQLGLFITKTYVELHRGRIWVESELGQGTAFFFTLPCAPIGDVVVLSSP